MARPKTEVRVSDDPALIAALRADAKLIAEAIGQSTVAQVSAGGYVNYKDWDALKAQPGAAWTAMRDILEDPNATAAGKANAAARLREFGDPAGEAYLVASLSDASAEVRAAAIEKLWLGDGDQIDLSAPDRLASLLNCIEDPDPSVAGHALLAASWRPDLKEAIDRIAVRLEAGTAPEPAEWGFELLCLAETPAHVRVALDHASPPLKFGHASSLWTLRRTLAHPDPLVREPTRKALLAECLRDPAERGEQGLARTLAQVADESTLPVLEVMAASAKDHFVQTYALGAIARLRPAEAIARILEHSSKSSASDGYAELLTKHATPADANRVLAALAVRKSHRSDYEMEQLIRLCLTTFGEAGRRAVEGWLPAMSKRSRQAAIWGLHGLNLTTALEAFASAGLLPLPLAELLDLTRKFHEKEQGKNSFDPTEPRSLTTALYCAGILVSFDAESDQVPSPHDELVMQFGRHSRGGFAPECAIQIPGEYEPDEEDDEDFDEELDNDEDDPDGPLRVRFLHGGRLYEFDPENYGDWYDVNAVAAAVNRAVADAGRPERFIEIETGGQAAEFVFADPARFAPLADRFAIPVAR